jgi:hypothetical protein
MVTKHSEDVIITERISKKGNDSRIAMDDQQDFVQFVKIENEILKNSKKETYNS